MYKISTLYKNLLIDHSPEEVDIIFKEELQKRNIVDSDQFIKNFWKREYDEETIVKYMDFVSFFQLNIQNSFSLYVFKKYVRNLKYLDLICNYHCVQYIIEEVLKKNNHFLRNEELLYISSYIDIKELNLYGGNCCNITDKGLQKCFSLQRLNVGWNKFITTCEPFANSLIELYAICDSSIGDYGLKNCVNLQILDASNNTRITTCEPFANTLIELYATSSGGIDDKGIQYCINLQKLYCTDNHKIKTCDPFADSLIELEASNWSGIDDKGLINCHKIQKLNVSNNYKIKSCEPFKDSIIELRANDDCCINDNEIKKCTKLKKLFSYNNYRITIKIE